MQTNIKTEALLLARSLPLNETIYSDCPSCGGRHKFSVTRTREGVLWNCFRDSCPVRGASVTVGELLPPKIKGPRLRPYTKPLHNLEVSDFDYVQERFNVFANIADMCAQVTEDERYALHVRDPRGYNRGVTIRNGWTGDPECPRVSDWDGPKTVLYMHAQGPTLSWYNTTFDERKLVLVEDQMSGMRCLQEGVSACALLGTSLDNDKVREIAQWKPDEVIIALDADATQTAFKLARQWGLAFKKTRVAVLERDLKDEDEGEIHHVLGL